MPDLRISDTESLQDLQSLKLDDGTWRSSVETIVRIARDASVEANRNWRLTGQGVAAYSERSLFDGLSTGMLPIRDERFEEAVFAVARSVRQRIDTVSYNDLHIWCAAEPWSLRYQVEKNIALLRGAVTRSLFRSPTPVRGFRAITSRESSNRSCRGRTHPAAAPGSV